MCRDPISRVAFAKPGAFAGKNPPASEPFGVEPGLLTVLLPAWSSRRSRVSQLEHRYTCLIHCSHHRS